MTDWPIGLSTGCFYHTSILEVLAKIRNSGFDVIEVCSYPDHLDYHDRDTVERVADRIAELGLEPFSFHAPFAEGIDITSPDSEVFDESVNEMMQALEAAAALRVRHFVIHPGPEREGKPPREEHFQRLKTAARALKTVARRSREAGVSLILENMLPHLLFGQTSDILWILGAIDEVGVGVCLDTGHANLAGDLDTVMHKLSGHLKLVHINDNSGKEDQHLPPGEGDIGWDRVLGSLEESGYAGSFILELSGSLAGEPDGILRVAREARRYIRDLSREMDLRSPRGKTRPA